MEKAIPLKQRGPKAVEEQMTWMMKLHGYTPVLATRDAAEDIARQLKAGKKRETVNSQSPWSHRTLKHGKQWCSYWWFLTPRGRKDIYFDTGVSVNRPGEVERQEAACADYIAKKWQSFNER
jgi:hypothetical protein